MSQFHSEGDYKYIVEQYLLKYNFDDKLLLVNVVLFIELFARMLCYVIVFTFGVCKFFGYRVNNILNKGVIYITGVLLLSDCLMISMDKL